MTNDFERGLSQELQEYIEAVRKVADATGYARAKAEKLQGAGRPSSPKTAMLPGMEKLEIEGADDWGSDDPTPRGLGLKYVEEIVNAAPTSAQITVLGINRRLKEEKRSFISKNTIRRALEKLAERKVIEQIDGTNAYRRMASLRSVS